MKLAVAILTTLILALSAPLCQAEGYENSNQRTCVNEELQTSHAAKVDQEPLAVKFALNTEEDIDKLKERILDTSSLDLSVIVIPKSSQLADDLVNETKKAQLLARIDSVILDIGDKRPVVDGIRNVLSIPLKILLWNSKMDSGEISDRGKQIIKIFMAANNIEDTVVSINQYKPQLVWKRTFTNPQISLLGKLFLGIPTALMYTFRFGRLTGYDDHYNPISDTVHLYSDDIGVALHELGHAKDFKARKFKSLYTLVRRLPWGTGAIYQEVKATSYALEFLKQYGTQRDLDDANLVLLPAFGSYAGPVIEKVSGYNKLVSTLIGVIGGHLVGRLELIGSKKTKNEN